MRGATQAGRHLPAIRLISIHAPHARSDVTALTPFLTRLNFNPRSSCEERQRRYTCMLTMRHFNPRSSCEERLAAAKRSGRVEKFQSTLLMRGATRRHSDGILNRCISIHAPHARSDVMFSDITALMALFQSTLLMRGATHDTVTTQRRKIFQSTLLMRGATAMTAINAVSALFQSTLLMRGATPARLLSWRPPTISIHAPHARSDRCDLTQDGRPDISIHAPHARSDV